MREHKEERKVLDNLITQFKSVYGFDPTEIPYHAAKLPEGNTDAEHSAVEYFQYLAGLTICTICTVCAKPTNTACSDCQIDLATTVYVCNEKYCLDIHEKNCPSVLKKEIEYLSAKLVSR